MHQAILFALTRLGSKSCQACEDKLNKQIERDEKAVRIPGAKDLLGETRVALAIIENKDTAGAPPPTEVAEADVPAPSAGKAKKAGHAAGKKKGHHK